ncbi:MULTISPECIES: hypothetical protein [unclassified Sphingomonas]|uniref:hypothetical protein n=1 Tax=Novosphingobium rhizosphaerae TaxID=1551649 RepID=UPI0015CE4368
MNTDEARQSRISKRARLILAATALVAVGSAAGAIAVAATRPSVEMAPLTPVAVRSLTNSDSIITIKGQAAEMYGNKFILADGTGRALVDTGRGGEDKTLVTAGQPVTVQGRFEHGFVHASFLIGPDGKVVSLSPMGPPHGPSGPHDERGPGKDHGPRADGPPPPTSDAPTPATAPSAAASTSAQ